MSFHSRKLIFGTPQFTDPFWNNTVLLLHGDGIGATPDGQQNNTFLDSSSNNFTITRNGTPTQGSFSPYALNGVAYSPTLHGGSGYFNGSTDYLNNYTAGAATATSFGTGDFTVEAFINFNSASGNQGICDASNQIGTNTLFGQFYFYKSTTSLIFGEHNFGSILTYSWIPIVGTWYHVAVSRSGTSLKMFINGTEVASATISRNFFGSGVNVGVIGTPYYFNGYISNLRVTKGLAVYTSNFTRPTSPVTLTSNGGATPSTAPTSGQVSLLCDFTNAGIFDSTEKNVLTTVGDAKVSTSVVKYGTGSMYFDGTGDYLESPKSANFDFGSGDFTIECWAKLSNPTPVGTYHCIFGVWNAASGGASDSWGLYASESGNLIFIFADGTLNIVNSTFRIFDRDIWTHLTVSKQNGVYRMFADGTQVGTLTKSSSINASSTTLRIMSNNNQLTFCKGYIDDLRITKGVARYTANFTPPTRAFPDK